MLALWPFFQKRKLSWSYHDQVLHVELPFAELFLAVLYQLEPDLIKTQTE